MHTSSAKRPAFVRGEQGVGAREIAPHGGGLQEVTGAVEHAERPGFVGEELARVLDDNAVRFSGGEARLQEIAHLREQRHLTSARLQLAHRARQSVVCILGFALRPLSFRDVADNSQQALLVGQRDDLGRDRGES